LINLPAKLPHALLFQHSPEFTCVAADDFEGAKLATGHLLQQGHRRISYLPSSDNDSISRQRLAGYEAAYKEAGIDFDKQWVRFLHKPRVPYRVAGETVMTSWMEEGWGDLKCTAILAPNDSAAIGIMQALRAKGLRIPDDVSVVGFDGTETSNLCTPRLTTIKVPLAEIGARAVKVLLQQMGEANYSLEKITLPIQLKVGESTAPRRTNEVNETLHVDR
jgi:DNA-binding LacI/PurR family transcriptional regulator